MLFNISLNVDAGILDNSASFVREYGELLHNSIILLLVASFNFNSNGIYRHNLIIENNNYYQATSITGIVEKCD